MTAPREPSALNTGALTTRADSADALIDGLIGALPEAAMLITPDGAIVVANAAAAELVGASPLSLRGAPLSPLVNDEAVAVERYLHACARTRTPLPGALHLGGSAHDAPSGGVPALAARHAGIRHAVSGSAVRSADASVPPMVLLRFRPSDQATNRFLLLNRQLDDLSREVRARRAAELALRDANNRLHQQALELELANQQLQDQAVELEITNQQLQDQAMELEQQIEQARAFADELAQANDRLVEAASAADAARALAEHANRAKSDFLAVMSHELRTPLNAIGGYAELLEMGIRGPTTRAQLEDLARIQRSQRHLLGLINEVLNFARLEAGKVHYSITEVDIDPLLRGLEGLIEPQVDVQGLHYVYEGAPAVARADAEKLQQVLLNLLSNAVKFTPRGGTIVVASATDDTHLRISVRDTGVGIAAEKCERIFEPFVQLDQRLTRKAEGVGLGLAISRDLVRGMGGELSVESVPGSGSTFTATLPVG